MRPPYVIFLLLLLLGGCQPNEEIITGDITGIIAVFAQDNNVLSDQSGVQVSLYRNSELLGTVVTDSRGQYFFRDIPYGKYRIDYQKEAFIKTWSVPPVFHAGGHSPTWASFWLYEIPTFEFKPDSIKFDNKNFELVIYLKIVGNVIPSPTNFFYHSFRVFFNNSPDVTSDIYFSQGKGYLYSAIAVNPEELDAIGYVYTYEINNNFDQLKSGTIYLRIYPLAQGSGLLD